MLGDSVSVRWTGNLLIACEPPIAAAIMPSSNATKSQYPAVATTLPTVAAPALAADDAGATVVLPSTMAPTRIDVNTDIPKVTRPWYMPTCEFVVLERVDAALPAQ